MIPDFTFAGDTGRPAIMGRRHVTAAGHPMSAQAGLQVLEAGGNAIDAGVAMGIATSILESHFVSFGGVAPIMIYLANEKNVITISGLGVWPRAASCTYFQDRYNGRIPVGLPRSVVPAAPDAWLTALEKFGTMSFADVAAFAIRFARDGFHLFPAFRTIIENNLELIASWPENNRLYLEDGRLPDLGKRMINTDLASTLQYMADEESAASQAGRTAGLQAARNAFYKGDIAARMVAFHEEYDGLMTRDDLSSFSVAIEPPVKSSYSGIDVYACGPWSQGPMLLEVMNLLGPIDLKAMGHNSARYIHSITEAIKLAAADREAYIGDPRFVDVPIDTLLSAGFAAQRRALIREDQAWSEMPPAGDVHGAETPASHATTGGVSAAENALDTSYCCAVDLDGNVFSATPSDGMPGTPVIPGLGFVCSPRGSQSWTDPAHASCIAPGKRPRLTPNPAIAIVDGKMAFAFGSPGGDVQIQAMLQTFLNVFLWGMDPQTAVEAPRFSTSSFPGSFEPHDYLPGRLNLEGRIETNTGDTLAGLGHDVKWWPERTWLAGSMCAIHKNYNEGLLTAAADPRRNAYAVGW